MLACQDFRCQSVPPQLHAAAFFSHLTQVCGAEHGLVLLGWTQPGWGQGPAIRSMQPASYTASSWLWKVSGMGLFSCIFTEHRYRVLNWSRRQDSKSHAGCPVRNRSSRKKRERQTHILRSSGFFCYPTIERFITLSQSLLKTLISHAKRKRNV